MTIDTNRAPTALIAVNLLWLPPEIGADPGLA
jgi:hypothetical protein